jgi:hypothetical protein
MPIPKPNPQHAAANIHSRVFVQNGCSPPIDVCEVDATVSGYFFPPGRIAFPRAASNFRMSAFRSSSRRRSSSARTAALTRFGREGEDALDFFVGTAVL